MPKVIVINGSGAVGKSTFISLCHEIDPRVIETSTVDFVKEIALQAGWDGIKDQRGRRLLSDIKDALKRYDDIPNKKIDEFIQSHPDNIIFVNAREPNHADENVNDYDYDIVINNSGTLEDLKETAKWFLTNCL